MSEILMAEGGRVLFVFMLGWITAQLIKVVVKFLISGDFKESFKMLFRSGGMPSGHTASVVGALAMAGRVKGFSSMEFAILAIFAMIVIYDAVNVRWAVGKNGEEINKLGGKVKIIRGHTMVEVIAGGALGALLGIII